MDPLIAVIAAMPKAELHMLLEGSIEPEPSFRLAEKMASACDAIGCEDSYRYLIHDRDTIFAKGVDESIGRLGLRVLKSPLRSPMANAICERVIGTIRRECLDWLIPVSESHLRSLLEDWRRFYNHSRPHMALGPGVPDPPAAVRLASNQNSRHRLGERLVVGAKSCWVGCTTTIHSWQGSRD